MFKLLLMKIITTATWEINRDEFDHIDQMLKETQKPAKILQFNFSLFQNLFPQIGTGAETKKWKYYSLTIHPRKTLLNKTQAPTKSIIRDIRVISTLNQLFISGSNTH